jgi:membrane protease YdiL (CAAX protease family)
LRSGLVVAGVLVALALLTVTALTVGGELGYFMLAGLEALPFLILAVLAQAGERSAWVRVLAYLWLGLLVFGLAILVLGFSVAVLGIGNPALARAQLVVLGSLLLAAPLLFRGVRVAVARLIPISPDSLPHKIALFFLVYMTLVSFGQLAALGGQPPLLVLADSEDVLESVRSGTGQLVDRLYFLAWIIPLTVVGAGYPLRRTLRAAVERLGFTRPTRQQVLIGLAMSAVLVGLATLVDQAIALIWQQMGWPTTDLEAFRKLVPGGFSPLSAIVIGITAGVGEEAATRGLLQPRLGKLLPNLAFVSVHAYQYSFDALLSVFLLGLVFALVRSWSSTTIAALVHGAYDFLVIILDVLGF